MFLPAKTKKLMLVAGCLILVTAGRYAHSNKKLNVSVSIAPLKYIAGSIGSDRLNITTVVPPGADPHTYDITPGILKKVQNSDLLLKIGSGIEFELEWFDKIARFAKNAKVVDCSENIEIFNKDPHIWVSYKNTQKIAVNILNALIKFDPQYEGYYRANFDKFAGEIAKEEMKIAGLAASAQSKKFLVLHPAWGYFARDFGLEQIAIEEEGKEPSSKKIAEVIDTAKSNGLGVVFVRSESYSKIVDLTAKEAGAKVVTADYLAENYAESMLKIAASMAIPNE